MGHDPASRWTKDLQLGRVRRIVRLRQWHWSRRMDIADGREETRAEISVSFCKLRSWLLNCENIRKAQASCRPQSLRYDRLPPPTVALPKPSARPALGI